MAGPGEETSVEDADERGPANEQGGDGKEIVKLKGAGDSWVATDDEVVVLDTTRSEYLAVNRTGTELWPLLVTGATREELVHALMSKFGISEGRAVSDVSVFVASLAERGML
jgi:Coenzyme PQQ synthesis protein D (PqqD)